jgi:hypothetical protein
MMSAHYMLEGRKELAVIRESGKSRKAGDAWFVTVQSTLPGSGLSPLTVLTGNRQAAQD